ncbi:hypothetical protein C8Q79DRAFT_925529 [Trametes meyenii]|nr:hypothetical protein C8Q79DRAFT_925529 [Trametes meyenii]
MAYGYSPSPARSEPASVTATSSNPYANFFAQQPTSRAVGLRRTYSVPSSFPTNRSPVSERPSYITHGLGIGLPATLTTHIHPSLAPNSRPRLRRFADLGLGTPLTALPVRSMRRRIAGSHPLSPVARSRSAGQPAGHNFRRLDVAEQGPRNIDQTSSEEQPHPTIALTLADAFGSDGEDSAGDEDENPRYSFLPPGLSSPVPWPSSPVSDEQPSPTSPYARPINFRTLAGPGIRAPGSNRSLGGAAISPSVSRFGTHHHFPGLDHSAGGVADEDALIPNMVAPSASRTRTLVPMTPRLASVDRFTHDPLYH